MLNWFITFILSKPSILTNEDNVFNVAFAPVTEFVNSIEFASVLSIFNITSPCENKSCPNLACFTPLVSDIAATIDGLTFVM